MRGYFCTIFHFEGSGLIMTVNYDHEFLVKVVRSFSVILGLHDFDETVKKKKKRFRVTAKRGRCVEIVDWSMKL